MKSDVETAFNLVKRVQTTNFFYFGQSNLFINPHY